MSQNILLTDALKAEGIPLPQEIVTREKFTRWGKHERFWAKAVGDGFIFGDFSKALSRTVFPKAHGKLSPSFIAIRQKKLEEQKTVAQREQKKYWEFCSIRARNIWEKGSSVQTHPYLTRKKISADGLKETISGSLIVPLSDTDGKIWTLQFITAAGKKFYMKSGLKKGKFHMFGHPKKRIFLCEGYATAASVFEAVNDCCVACMDAKNIQETAGELKAKYPSADFIFCADDDKYSGCNTGMINAENAAFIFKGIVIHPFFKEADGFRMPTDFNDVACLYGIEQLRHQIFDIWGIKP